MPFTTKPRDPRPSKAKWYRANRFISAFLVIGCGTLLTVYQNFGYFDDGEIDGKEIDIRGVAPQRPDGYGREDFKFRPNAGDRTPQALGSHLLNDQMQPYVQEYQDKVNEKIDVLLHGRKKANTEEYASLESGSAAGTTTGSSDQKEMRLDLRMTSSNSFRMDVGDTYKVNCTLDPNDVKLSLARPLGSSTDLTLSHQTGAAKTSVNIDYRF